MTIHSRRPAQPAPEPRGYRPVDAFKTVSGYSVRKPTPSKYARPDNVNEGYEGGYRNEVEDK